MLVLGLKRCLSKTALYLPSGVRHMDLVSMTHRIRTVLTCPDHMMQ